MFLAPIPTRLKPIGHKSQARDDGPNLEDKSLAEILPHFTEKERQLFTKARFKAMYGGRAGRKSHAIAEYILARMILDAELQAVVFRKYRSAVTYSAQLLLKNKIRDMGWGRYFEVLSNTIRRRDGSGFIAFTGIQDHNATSIKSYENFKIAWGEESTEIDQYSLDLLVPTLRAPGAELLFSWNPDQPTDPVDKMFRVNPPSNAIVIPVSFKDNRFLSDESRQDEQDMLQRDPEKHAWVWLGEYNVHSNAIIFAGRWRVDVVNPATWDGPYFGLDFGFVVDPTASARQWRSPDGTQIYIEQESYRYALQIDHIATRLKEDLPGVENYVIRADSSEQDTIDYLQRHGLPRIVPVEKGPGSVETGVKWLKNHEIIVHPDCVHFQEELRRYRLKTNKAGDVLDEIVDKDNHLIDQCIEYGQLVATEHGDIPIQDINIGDKVWTRKGLRTVSAAVMTSPDADVLELVTASGQKLRATGNHLVFVNGKGFLPLDELRYNDEVMLIGFAPCHIENPLNIAALPGTDTQCQNIPRIASILSALRRTASQFGFIGKCGAMPTGQFLKDTKFITETATQRTTKYLTSNALILLVIKLSIQLGAAGQQIIASILKRLGRLLRLGIAPQKDLLSTVKMHGQCGPTMLERLSNAVIAKKSSQQKPWAALTNIAQTNASRQHVARRELMTTVECAKTAEVDSPATSTQRPVFVLDRVRCVSVTGQRNKVYDLTVDDAEEFFASGVLVHNCRYGFQPLIKAQQTSLEALQALYG